MCKKNKCADGNLLSADYPDPTLLRTSAPAFNPLHRVAVRVDDRSALFFICLFVSFFVCPVLLIRRNFSDQYLQDQEFLEETNPKKQKANKHAHGVQ